MIQHLEEFIHHPDHTWIVYTMEKSRVYSPTNYRGSKMTVLRSFSVRTVMIWFIYAAVLLLSPQLVFSTASCNTTIQFPCASGTTCIPIGWKCDNIPDCQDQSDERNCNYAHKCMNGTMICPDGTCIALVFKCDGEADCPDGHDEKFCSDPAEYVPCPFPKFLCKYGGGCIADTAICDGIKDCPGGEDEAMCRNLTCPSHLRKCASEVLCIPLLWVCDGSDDCSDGSDEEDCENFVYDSLDPRPLCTKDEYHCKADIEGEEICIPVDQLCDGTPQCPRKDDEDETRCRLCKSSRCEHKCRFTPSAVECYCPDGSTRKINLRNCTEVDFCQTEEGKKCQQYCTEVRNGHACSCASGYVLKDDEHTCWAYNRPEGSILISIDSQIRIMPMYDASKSPESYRTFEYSSFPHGYKARFIEYDNQNGLIFVLLYPIVPDDEAIGALAVIDANNSMRIIRENIEGINHLAFDPIGRNLYFTQTHMTRGGVYVCSADAFYCRRIISTPTADPNLFSSLHYTIYGGLALNPLTGRMIWAELHQRKFRMYSANMDGTEPNILVDDKDISMMGIAFDHVKDEVYIGDLEHRLIEKINFKTGDRRVVVSKGVHRPHDIKYFEGVLYWTDWGTDSLKSFEVYSREPVSPQTLHTFTALPLGIAFNQSMYRAFSSPSPCDRIKEKCLWLCVPVPDSSHIGVKAVCICPDGYSYSEGECIPGTVRPLDPTDSYIASGYMRRLCELGSACLNGGECSKEIFNNTTRFSCSCTGRYQGIRCEYYKPMSWTIIVFFCLIVIVAGTAFLCRRQLVNGVVEVRERIRRARGKEINMSFTQPVVTDAEL